VERIGGGPEQEGIRGVQKGGAEYVWRVVRRKGGARGEGDGGRRGEKAGKKGENRIEGGGEGEEGRRIGG